MTTYLITEAQRDELRCLVEFNKPAIDLLQSLPMVDSEPVAWINKDSNYVELSTKSTVYGSHTIPLYTSPQTITPITADDVTDEMLDAIEQSKDRGYRALAAVAVNAYLVQHRSEPQ